MLISLKQPSNKKEQVDLMKSAFTCYLNRVQALSESEFVFVFVTTQIEKDEKPPVQAWSESCSQRNDLTGS